MSENNAPAISFGDVTKKFGDNAVLDNVSFSVPDGNTLCILGRSGTGKSVTLKIMIGLMKPDKGQVCIQGEDISGMDEDGLVKVRRHMGFLFQSAALFDSFTIGKNLYLPLQRFQAKAKNEMEAHVQEVLKSVGLEKASDKMPAELSGGMRKRAGLARALVLEPKILLIDEPSSGLDRVTSSEIDHLLLSIKEKQKTTMVIVTHDPAGARRLGDQLAVLDHGKLAAMGTADELKHHENELVRALVSEEA